MVLFLNVPIETDISAQVFREIGHQVHAGGITIHIFRLDVAILPSITQRSVITGVFRTAGNAHSVRMRHGVLSQELEPVGIYCFITLHFGQKLIVGNLPRLVTVVGTLVTHHRHVRGESIVQVA